MLKYNFYSCYQKNEMSNATFVAELKQKSVDCGFRDRNFMIRA